MTDFLSDQLQALLGAAYTIERELGGGGMARVFVAEETALARKVVIKVLPPETSGAVSADRFRREIQVAARLQHPHVVTVHSTGRAGELLYYTMPFVEGETLRERLRREGELPVAEAVRLLREVADALDYAHGRGVVHRDLKPENVLVSGRHALVTDFGVAKALSAAAGVAGGAVTSAGVALGTPAYMAPEQAAADPQADHRVDLYALGIVAYEVLTGSHPFAGRPAQAVLAAHAMEVPEPITRRRPGVSPALGAHVMRLLEKRPADRPQSAEEVLRALEAVAMSDGGSRGANVTHPSAPRPTAPQRRAIVFVATALLLVGAGYAALAGDRGRDGRSGATATTADGAAAPVPARTASVAVLPFLNIGGDTGAQYFADGMTEELIGALSKVEGLRVPGRTSVFALRGKNLDARTIGDTLRVATVLEGSVRRAGGRLRVGAQLVSAESNDVLWSETYDRVARDVFAVQDEISRAIVAALRLELKLASGGDTTLVRPGTADLESHDLYLRGRFLWNQRTYESLRAALGFFERAIRRDSSYARAFAGLAETYLVLPFYGPVRPTDVFPKAKAAALRGLALDSTLAEARAALGYARMLNDYDWPGAEADFRRAIARDPNYATAYQWYAIYLGAVGRLEEAVAEAERARTLDPISRVVATELVNHLLATRRYDDALRALRGTLELDPNFALAHDGLCMVYLARGALREAVAECERANALDATDRALGRLGYAYAVAGERAKGEAMLRELETRRRQRGYARPIAFATVHLGLGDTARAFEWLDSAVVAHDPGLTYLAAPLWDPLRADPRFARLRARMGLAP